jgi:hypothetical protein
MLGRRALLVVTIALGGGMAACGGKASGIHGTRPAPATQLARAAAIYWMWSPGHLKTLIAAGLTSAEAQAFADTPTSIFNLTVGHQDAAHVASIEARYPNAQIDALFNSEADIAKALATNTLPKGLTAIAYDPERTPSTPAPEQSALGSGDTHYVTSAISLAHSHHLKLYFVPSVDVGMAGNQGGFPNKYATWLSQRRGYWARLGEDLYSIQSQQSEGTPTFAGFVPRAVSQAKAAAPNIPVDVGIGINPHNPPTCVTTQNILNAYNVGLSADANGFWNNVEMGNCHVSATVYVQFFNNLYKTRTTTLP